MREAYYQSKSLLNENPENHEWAVRAWEYRRDMNTVIGSPFRKLIKALVSTGTPILEMLEEFRGVGDWTVQ